MRSRVAALGAWPALRGALLIAALLGAAGAGVPPRRIDSDRDPGVISFPRALGAHPDAALEWWYVTAILRDDDGRTLGAQWTLFRVRLDRLGGGAPATGAAPAAGGAPSAWRPGDLYFAHVAIGDSASHSFGVAERVGRTGIAIAGADTADLDVRIRDWFLRRGSDGRFRLRGANDERTLELTLTPSRPRPVAWGPAFRSAKSPDPRYFSRYQTDPWMRAEGTISPGPGAGRPVRGTAWFDHEWSDGAFDSAVVGWDWLGARLGDGRAVMLYRLRDARGGTRHFFGGIVERDGRVIPVGPGQARWSPLREWRSPRTEARYPVAWRILLEPPGAARMTLDFGASFDAQELVTDKSTRVTYWEGMVSGTAEEEGARTPLEGYLELTGYAGGGVPGRISSGEPTGR
ncbi:MAG TPA: lipocalin-like domain-containing protein [Candidatus Eisenbacteria bacterium]|nr:lipocalin-like domain-containing protein [Candidatus Eisenbacteria bacterium]